MKYDFRARSDAALVYNSEPSKTKQDFKASCDINNILKKYTKNGVNPFLITANAKYGDFTSVPSFHDAMSLVSSAAEHFATLPALVRRRFGNDPGSLLDFLRDPSNRDEAVKLGLINPKSDQNLNNSETEKKSPASPVSSSPKETGSA